MDSRDLDTVTDGVRATLVDVLGIDPLDVADADTPLLGELPELDSLGIVELAAALEDRFGVVLEDDDFTGDTFATVGSLAEVVAARLPASAPVT